MRTFKKIAAALLMAISALTLVALLAGIIGSWIVRAQVEVAGTNLLLTGETSITAVRQGLSSADRLLGSSLSSLNEITTRAEAIGALAADNRIIVDGVLGRLNVDVAAPVTRATDTLDAVENNLVAINDAILAIDAIPLLRVDVGAIPGVAAVSETLEMLQQIRQDVRDFIAAVETRRQEIVSGAKEQVIEPAVRLNGRLQEVVARLADADARLATTAESLASLRQRLPAILTWITIALNVFFALSMLAFASLFTHAWQYYRCPDDGLRGLLPPDPCRSATLPATVIRPTK